MNVSHVPVGVRGGVKGTSILEHLPEVEVALSVELGRTQVNLRDLLSWREGDLLRLDTRADAPMTATVEGKPSFLANPRPRAAR